VEVVGAFVLLGVEDTDAGVDEGLALGLSEGLGVPEPPPVAIEFSRYFSAVLSPVRSGFTENTPPCAHWLGAPS